MFSNLWIVPTDWQDWVSISLLKLYIQEKSMDGKFQL